jgi:transposase
VTTTKSIETPAGGDGIGLAEALLGLDGFRVLAVSETPAEVVIGLETTADLVGCPGCGVRAEAQDRMVVEIRDLACFGRPARLVWSKRRWRCREPLCPGSAVDGHMRRSREAKVLVRGLRVA